LSRTSFTDRRKALNVREGHDLGRPDSGRARLGEGATLVVPLNATQTGFSRCGLPLRLTSILGPQFSRLVPLVYSTPMPKRTSVAEAVTSGCIAARLKPRPSRISAWLLIAKARVVQTRALMSRRRRARGRCLLACPAVQQLHQRLVQTGFHGMPLTRPGNVAHVHFDSRTCGTQADRGRG
jgi:hypothetical protein